MTLHLVILATFGKMGSYGTAWHSSKSACVLANDLCLNVACHIYQSTPHTAIRVHHHNKQPTGLVTHITQQDKWVMVAINPFASGLCRTNWV